MSISEFHIKLATAYPNSEEAPSPKGRTFRAQIESDDEQPFAYIKLLRVEDLAKEALCAVLARKLHLPMLQPYYVSVDPYNFQDHPMGNAAHIAFGLEEDSLPTFRIRGQQIEDELLKWPELYRCAIFDEWIANNDRFPNNLLYAGNQHFWLIDHDEALPNINIDEPVQSQLLSLISKGKSELDLHRIRKKMLGYAKAYKEIDWDEIFNLVQPEMVPGLEQHISKYIKFLSERANVMSELISTCLDIRQAELRLINNNSTKIDRSQ